MRTEGAFAAIDRDHNISERITWHQVNLSDWKAVQAIGDKIKSSTDRLDILINNAGRGIMTYEASKIDRHMSVNHFSHVFLTTSLLPRLKKTPENNVVRIVNQSSNAHHSAPEDVEFASEGELNTDLGPSAQYGRSKLANLLYAWYLARHLKPTHPCLLINATHPGYIETAQSTRDIHEPYPILGYGVSTLLQPLKKTQWEGAVSTLYASTVAEQSGMYICLPAVPEEGGQLAQDEELGECLMKLTREILCREMDVPKWEAV